MSSKELLMALMRRTSSACLLISLEFLVLAIGVNELRAAELLSESSNKTEGKQLPLSEHANPQQYALDSLYPRGTHLPLGFYSVDKNDYLRVKDAGCSFVGPYYGKDQLDYLAAAEEAGLKFLFSVGPASLLRDDDSPNTNRDIALLDLKELHSAIVDQMRPVLEHDRFNETVAWWYLKPEELRHWREDEMKYLESVANAIRELDPMNRPVWMYEPNHRSSTDLAKTGEHLDIIGKGTYVNTGKTTAVNPKGIPHVWTRWSLDQEIGAIDLLESSPENARRQRTPIAVLEMSQDFAGESQKSRIAEHIRHDVYLSLVSGAKGIAVWSAARRSGFQSHEQFLNAYLSAFGELTGPAELDKAILFGHRNSNLLVQVTDGPSQIDLVVKAGDKKQDYVYPSIAHLDVTYEDDRFLFLVNSSERHVKVSVTGYPSHKLPAQEVFGKVPNLSVQGTLSTALAPLEVQIWKLQTIPRQAALKNAVSSRQTSPLDQQTSDAPNR